MDQIELNKLSGKKGIPVLPNDTMGLSYIENYVDREPIPARYPITAKCDSINQRVKAQSGMFSIHGDEENDIITTILDKKSAIYRIDISTEAISSLNDYFDISGIKDYTIFPDIQGQVIYGVFCDVKSMKLDFKSEKNCDAENIIFIISIHSSILPSFIHLLGCVEISFNKCMPDLQQKEKRL